MRRPCYGLSHRRERRSHRRRQVRRQGLRHQPGFGVVDDGNGRGTHCRGSGKTHGWLRRAGEGRKRRRPERRRPRETRRHGGGQRVPDAREMRNARLAHDEISIGGRRHRQNGMNAEPLRAEITASALSVEELEDFTRKLVVALKSVYDPEIPVDIYELGLIYKVDVADNKDVTVDMTLTAP